MVGPLGGGGRDPGVATMNVKNIDGGPLGRRWWRYGNKRPSSMQETSTMVPLGGNARDLGAPTINAKKHR
jgi:hypothetical protein